MATPAAVPPPKAGEEAEAGHACLFSAPTKKRGRYSQRPHSFLTHLAAALHNNLEMEGNYSERLKSMVEEGVSRELFFAKLLF